MSLLPVIDCPYYHYDFFRGRETEACRLLESSPDVTRPWRRALCRTCPVPRTMAHTDCDHLLLEANVRRRFLAERVYITFALCGASLEELAHPQHCPACTAARQEWAGHGDDTGADST